MRSASSARSRFHVRLFRAPVIDLIVVGALIPIVIVFSIVVKPDLGLFVLLYYGLPALFLCCRKKKNYRKIISASLVLGVLFGMAYDMAAEFHNAYFTSYQYSLLSWHIAGNTPFGDVLWAFLIPFYTIIFYEHFLDDEKISNFSCRARFAVVSGIALFAVSWAVLHFNPTFPKLPYAYAFLGLLTALPLLGIATMRRSSFWKLALLAGFFFMFNFFAEVEELYLHQGGYAGQYVGWIPLVVARMPIEEFVYWTLLSAPAFIFCYEWLFDDFR